MVFSLPWWEGIKGRGIRLIKRLTDVSKKLRRQSTEAEKRLWSRLRAKQMEAFKFRRQQQIGNYIADFVCFEKGLIIELDGGQHAIDMERDKQRDDWLKSEGFEVVRFWNTDLFENIEGVLEAIRMRLLAPSLGPSHKGREDEKKAQNKYIFMIHD
jgi:very-short-patch-repair endonuclease